MLQGETGEIWRSSAWKEGWSRWQRTTADLGPKFRGGQMLSGGAYLRAQNVSGGVCLFCGSRRQYLI